jgi:hypothetical protein
MNKKTVSVITLITFVVFTVSCSHTNKKISLQEAVAKSRKGEQVEIMAALKSSGERIEYKKDAPARIVGDKIVSEGSFLEKYVEMEVAKTDVKKKRSDVSNSIYEVIMSDGTTYRIVKDSYKEKGDRATFTAIIQEHTGDIPLSEVELVWVRKVDPVKTFIVTVGGITLASLGVGLLIALVKECCPFVYSFDGERYIFDAEPYGGAICEGMKRTEWCNLKYLKEAEGLYKFILSNEVDETQYTDEIKLLVVDHPKGTRVIPDEKGHLHTLSRPVGPEKAYDGKGRDLVFLVGENDWIYWKTREDEMGAEKRESLKEEIVFEFPKPEGAREAKLLFNGCNTLWSSQMIKRFLELYGNEIGSFYENMKVRGSGEIGMLRQWNEREELYRLQLRVETEEGWKSKGTMVGGGPFVSEDRIYTIDLRDVPGDTLRIKLTPPMGFWQINYMAVDYTQDLPVDVMEMAPLQAFDQKNQDVRDTLVHTDGSYLVMLDYGDRARVEFMAVPGNEGMERTYILKVSGYYEIHLESEGAARMDILRRIFMEPGYPVKYALEEYHKWQREKTKSGAIR